MLDYNLVEEKLNEEAKKILLLIKKDYYSYMSPKKKQILDDLIDNKQIVMVNQGVSHFNDNTLAHGGRALNDGRVHFYPDVRGFDTKEAIETCKRLLPHECFHYFIQPDKEKLKDELDKKMASFYTEGLVEKEARKFCERHKKEVAFKKANYGYNINFVDMIQDRLGASSYEIVFSENNYIRDVSKYISEYKGTLKQKKQDLDVITEIVKSFPTNLQNKVLRRMKNMVLQDGNTIAVKEKLKTFEFNPVRRIEQLDVNNEKELE